MSVETMNEDSWKSVASKKQKEKKRKQNRKNNQKRREHVWKAEFVEKAKFTPIPSTPQEARALQTSMKVDGLADMFLSKICKETLLAFSEFSVITPEMQIPKEDGYEHDLYFIVDNSFGDCLMLRRVRQPIVDLLSEDEE